MGLQVPAGQIRALVRGSTAVYRDASGRPAFSHPRSQALTVVSDAESLRSAMIVPSVRITAAELAVLWPIPRAWARSEATVRCGPPVIAV
ncbi:hypothetical protein Ato02nite_062220 [Paractinoplanes toevensis]|uniref:Uncharacterized protein n=1 Tax=Paractinoplanes toevensis TaxID=571911 RepID=A0A919W4R4_9ACTN|nr:hypothetical protein Ato02nite_062220 [Actinoplanes toevensis]